PASAGPARTRGTAGGEQGRRPARHSRLLAPPGKLKACTLATPLRHRRRGGSARRREAGLFCPAAQHLVRQIAAEVQQSVTKSDLRQFRSDVTLRTGIVSFGTFRMVGDMGIAPPRPLTSTI